MLQQLQREQKPMANYRLSSVNINKKKKTIQINLTESFATIVFKESFIDSLKAKIKQYLPKKQKKYQNKQFSRITVQSNVSRENKKDLSNICRSNNTNQN